MPSYLQIINQAKNSWIKCFILLPSGKRPLGSQVWGSIHDWLGILHWPLAPGPWSTLSCPEKSPTQSCLSSGFALQTQGLQPSDALLAAVLPVGGNPWEWAFKGQEEYSGLWGAGNPRASRAWGTRFWLKHWPWPFSSCRKGHSWRRAEQAVSSKA